MVPDSAIELTGFSVHRSDRTEELKGKAEAGVFASTSTTHGVMKGTYVTVCVCVDGITLRAGGWSLKISLLEPVTDKLGQTRPKAG